MRRSPVNSKRRAVKMGGWTLLLVVATAPACIFDQGNYQGGGRAGTGASTAAGTGSSSATDTATATATAAPTDTTTSTAGMDSGATTVKDAGGGG